MKRSAISRVKDAALQKALLLFLRPKLERYGEVEELALDTTTRVFKARIRLLGEETRLTIDRATYRLESDGDDTVLIVENIEVSRLWLQNLLNDHVPEIRWKVPDFVRALIK